MHRLLVLFIRNQQFSMAVLLGSPGVQGVVHFMPGLQHCLPVGDGGSSLPCLVQRTALLQTPALEDRKIDRRADGEEPGIQTVEVVELEGFDADPAFQADRSEVRRVGEECVRTSRSRGATSHYKNTNQIVNMNRNT